MENHNGNVVMFPKWKTRLENAGLQALKEKRFQDAVDSLQPLLEYDVANDDVITGLLMSWIEVGQFEEAEDLCRQQMKVSLDENYYHYLHMYITILFQRSRYREIVDLLDEVFESEDIPHQSRTQLWQMYEVSRKLLEDYHKEHGKKLQSDFFEALEQNDLHRQWRALEQLKKQSVEFYMDSFRDLPADETVHPIIKTSVIEWFRDSKVSDKVKVMKFGQSIEIIPSELNQFQSDYMIKQIQLRLGDMEQSNPSMYEMVNHMLHSYCYVRYPLFPDEEEVPVIVETLKQLGHGYLQLSYEADASIDGVEKYKEEIELCEQHYTIIVGES